MTKPMTAKELQQIVSRMERELNSAREMLYNALCDLHKIHKGDFVKVTVGRKAGKQFQVTQIDFSMGFGASDRPWLMGKPILKDGSIGKASQNLYSDWERVK